MVTAITVLLAQYKTLTMVNPKPDRRVAIGAVTGVRMSVAGSRLRRTSPPQETPTNPMKPY